MCERLHASRDGLMLGSERFFLKGASYFGMETDILVPHGLWGGAASTTIARVLTLLRFNGFNLVRLPLAADAVLNNAVVDRYKIGNEAALLHKFEGRELRYLDVLDYTVGEIGRHGLLVLLDMHVLHAGQSIPELWHDGSISDEAFTRAWTALAHRYSSVKHIIGADLNNEPHGAASWGDGNPSTDWRLAATRIGAAVLQVSPRWLVFVEGVQCTNEDVDREGSPCCWGEDLQAARCHPIELSVPERLVYSPHTYGPAVAHQPYIDSPTFPNNLPAIWNSHFGFLGASTPLVIGEFGGQLKLPKDAQWQRAFVQYLTQARGISGVIYWCVNCNSGDTDGLLCDDWNTPRDDVLDLLSVFHGSPVPASLLPVHHDDV